jgi:hypothetical protein
LLKQKDKQTDNQIKNFALKLAKYLPYSTEEIMGGLTELLNEGVLQNGGDKLSQKRMIKDNEISLVRSDAGKKGYLAKAKGEAKPQANAENENVIVIDYENIVENYHSMCPKLNKVVVVNDLRKGFINARIGEFGIEKVINVIRLAGESDFLNGKNDKAWKADFEWILRPTNFIKIMEGKYKNHTIIDNNKEELRILKEEVYGKSV